MFDYVLRVREGEKTALDLLDQKLTKLSELENQEGQYHESIIYSEDDERNSIHEDIIEAAQNAVRIFEGRH